MFCRLAELSDFDGGRAFGIGCGGVGEVDDRDCIVQQELGGVGETLGDAVGERVGDVVVGSKVGGRVGSCVGAGRKKVIVTEPCPFW